MPIIEIVGRFAGSPVALDHALIVVIALIAPFVEWLWLYPRHVRASAAGVPGARPGFYALGLATQWILTGCAIAVWRARARPWDALGLGSGPPLRLGVGLAVAALVVIQLATQQRMLLASPKRLEAVMRRLVAALPMLPHTRGERLGFRAISITAGICEELLYRGYLTWYVGVWTGPIPAVVISSIAFGAAHVYLNRDHAVRATLLGLALATLVLATGSLWPAMIIHAASDLASGELGFHALTRAGEPSPGPTE